VNPTPDRLTGLLTKLQAAQDDAEREWIVLQLTLERLSPPLRAALWAAAVPHWFDAPFLAALLALPAAPAADHYPALQALPIVAPYPERGHALHESARDLLLARLWDDDRDHYCALSRRAAAHCASQDQSDTLWRAETLYHNLLAAEPGAVAAYASQSWDWYNTFAYDKLALLAQALLEPAQAGRLPHKAAAQTYETLGDVHYMLSEYQEARARYEQALPIYREIGARLGQANAIKSLGDVHRMLAEYQEARARYEQSLPIYREIGDRLGQANAISSLGDVHLRVSEYGPARERYEQALPIYREIGARHNESICLGSLGLAYAYLHDYDRAIQSYDRAIQLNPEYANAHFNKACAYALLENPAQACRSLEQAITLNEKYREMAQTDSDFDPIRHTPTFQALVEKNSPP
jgi:tetratricopeptide (TPR) repeat protein